MTHASEGEELTQAAHQNFDSRACAATSGNIRCWFELHLWTTNRSLQRSCSSMAEAFRCLPIAKISSRVTKNSVVQNGRILLRQSERLLRFICPCPEVWARLYEQKEGSRLPGNSWSK